MRKFVQKYALISSEELDEIGHTAIKHPVHALDVRLSLDELKSIEF